MAEDNRDIAKLLLIPAGTVLSYGVAYTFQSGHAEFFSVPHEFVDVTLASGLNAAIATSLFFVLCFYWINLPVVIGMQLLADKDPFWKRMTIVTLGIVSTTIVLFLGFGFSWLAIFFVVVIVLYAGSVFVFSPIITERFIKRTGRPLTRQIEEGLQPSKSPDALDVVIQFVGMRWLFLLVICPAVLLGIGYLAGYYSARSQKTFYGLKGTDFVCIGRYGAHFVFRKYDTKQQSFQNEFMALESSDMSSRQLMKTFIKNPQFENK
jgi:hypothetical protein